MKALFFCIFLMSVMVSAEAQTIVAAHAIRARSIISVQDLAILEQDTAGGITSASDIIGLEARVNLYAGRPIRKSEVGAPAILERNQW